MLLSQQFFYLLIGVGVLFGLPAFWLFTTAMWPRMASKAQEVASKGLLVSFLLGLPLIVIDLVFLNRLGKVGQIGGILGIIFTGLLAMWSLAGLAGLAKHVGERLWPASIGDDAWRAVWRGGLVIAGTLAIPFIGWYVLLSIMLAIGTGIRVRMWFVRAPQAQSQLQSDPVNLSALAPPVPHPTLH